MRDLQILEKEKILGEGAFSEVIKVKNSKDNMIYALKKIDADQVSSEDLQNLN